jgi:DNA-binding NarL/FixJ family response regulator
MTKLRILLVEDHCLVRTGLRMLINEQPDMEVVGEAGDGRTALAAAKELKPDVVVLDIVLPDMHGAVVTERLVEATPDSRILALTVQQDRAYVRQMMGARAGGYVLKLTKPPEFLQGIRTVAAGGIYIDPHIARKTRESSITPIVGTDEPRRRMLTSRDIELIQSVARGYSNREIAERMDVTVKTVETYKARIMDKLGFRSRVRLIEFAIHQGWLSTAETG